jgi:hypothetical protein
MSSDPLAEKLFEMKLEDIYRKHSWLSDELSLKDFVALFPIIYKKNKPVQLNSPADFDLSRDIFLEVLVAFKQSFI